MSIPQVKLGGSPSLYQVEESQREFDMELSKTEKPHYRYMLIPSGGCTIQQAADDAAEYAQATEKTILLVFNAQGLFCRPEDSAEDIVEAFRS